MACHSLATARKSNCPSNRWKKHIYKEFHRDEMSMINIGANSGSNVNEFLLEHDPSWKITPSLWHTHANVACGVCGACKARVPRSKHPVKSIRVIAVELLLVNYIALSSNFQAFNVPGIALNAAGGSQMGFAAAPREARLGVENMGIAKASSDTIDVPMVSVDGLISMFHWNSTIDLLSIDTEGNDALVLEGARKGLKARQIRIVEFEYHKMGEWRNRRLNDTVTELMTFGYTCFWQGNRKFSQYEIHCSNEFHAWSNLVCAYEPPIVNAFYDIARLKDSNHGSVE